MGFYSKGIENGMENCYPLSMYYCVLLLNIGIKDMDHCQFIDYSDVLKKINP